MITHSVYFNLKHSEGSLEESRFLEKVVQLKRISSIKNFAYVREVSPKNEYRFGLILQFKDQDSYNFYNEHPDHRNFVKNIWAHEVKDFIEIDYIEIDLRE